MKKDTNDVKLTKIMSAEFMKKATESIPAFTKPSLIVSLFVAGKGKSSNKACA